MRGEKIFTFFTRTAKKYLHFSPEFFFFFFHFIQKYIIYFLYKNIRGAWQKNTRKLTPGDLVGSCGILWDLVIVILWDLVGSEKLKSSIGKNPLPQDPTRTYHQEKKIKTEKKRKKVCYKKSHKISSSTQYLVGNFLISYGRCNLVKILWDLVGSCGYKNLVGSCGILWDLVRFLAIVWYRYQYQTSTRYRYQAKAKPTFLIPSASLG